MYISTHHFCWRAFVLFFVFLKLSQVCFSHQANTHENTDLPPVNTSPFIHLPKTPTNLIENSALLIIDVQNCFLPGGAIPIEEGNDIIPVINKIRDSYYFKSIVCFRIHFFITCSVLLLIFILTNLIILIFRYYQLIGTQKIIYLLLKTIKLMKKLSMLHIGST